MTRRPERTCLGPPRAAAFAVIALAVFVGAAVAPAQQHSTGWRNPTGSESSKIDAAIAEGERIIDKMPDLTEEDRQLKKEAEKNLDAFKKMWHPTMPPGDYGPAVPRVFIMESNSAGGETTSETGAHPVYGPISGPNPDTSGYEFTSSIGKGGEAIGINSRVLSMPPCVLAIVLMHEGGRARQVCSSKDEEKGRKSTQNICLVDMKFILTAKTECPGAAEQLDFVGREVYSQYRTAGGTR